MSVVKAGTAVSIAIIDSTRTGIDAASIANTSTPSLTPTSVSSGTYLSYTSGTTTIPTRYVKSKTELLNIDPWIRDNTRADIDYLYTKSGSLVAGDAHTRVIHEITATLPPSTDATALDALCPDQNLTGVAGTHKIYWRSLIGTVHNKCQDSNLVGFADYTIDPNDTKMYFKDSSINLQNTTTTTPVASYYDLTSKNIGNYNISVT